MTPAKQKRRDRKQVLDMTLTRQGSSVRSSQSHKYVSATRWWLKTLISCSTLNR